MVERNRWCSRCNSHHPQSAATEHCFREAKGCPDCGNDMSEAECPTEILCFRIPLTSFEIRIWRWKREPFCGWCSSKDQRETERAIADSAHDAGFQKGFREATELYR